MRRHTADPRAKPGAVCCLLLPLLCCVAAAEIVLVGPDTAEVGRSIEVDVDGCQLDLKSFEKQPPQIEWKTVPAAAATLRSHLELKVVVDEKTKKTKWIIAPYATITPGQEGRLGVVCMVVADGVGGLAVHEVTVGEEPKPDPDPDPDPPPPPPDPLWGGVLIEESARRTADIARLLSNLKIRQAFETRGLVFNVVDQNTKTPDGKAHKTLAPYVEMAQEGAGNLPCLILVGQAGKIHYRGPPPPTVAGWLQLIEGAGGRLPPAP